LQDDRKSAQNTFSRLINVGAHRALRCEFENDAAAERTQSRDYDAAFLH
jgi:hypothetical protein